MSSKARVGAKAAGALPGRSVSPGARPQAPAAAASATKAVKPRKSLPDAAASATAVPAASSGQTRGRATEAAPSATAPRGASVDKKAKAAPAAAQKASSSPAADAGGARAGTKRARSGSDAADTSLVRKKPIPAAPARASTKATGGKATAPRRAAVMEEEEDADALAAEFGIPTHAFDAGVRPGGEDEEEWDDEAGGSSDDDDLAAATLDGEDEPMHPVRPAAAAVKGALHTKKAAPTKAPAAAPAPAGAKPAVSVPVSAPAGKPAPVAAAPLSKAAKKAAAAATAAAPDAAPAKPAAAASVPAAVPVTKAEKKATAAAAATTVAAKSAPAPVTKASKKAAASTPVATKPTPAAVKSVAPSAKPAARASGKRVAAPVEEDEEDAPVVPHKRATLLDSDDDGDQEEEDAGRAARPAHPDDDEDMGDDDEDVEEDEDAQFERLGGDIEAAQKRLAAQTAKAAKESSAEMQRNMAAAERFHLPSERELEEERLQPPNIQSLQRRIRDIVEVLSDFRAKRDPLRARTEYVECLSQDMADFFQYNRELVDMFMTMFSPAEALAFFEANDAPRPRTIRVNTLRTRRRELVQALTNRGARVEPVGRWSKLGLKVLDSDLPIGATPEYLGGHYMLQSPSSFVPVMALHAQPGERVLDMCAAPGGKTTHIAQMMANKGVLVANDVNKPERLAALSANIARMGVTCATVTCMDGRKIPQRMGSFDRVLLDAPCSGLGVIWRDPSVKLQKGRADILKMAFTQKQLIVAACDCLDANSKTGGYLVYSTCSVSVEENEAVVNYLLHKRHVKLVPLFNEDEDQEDVGLPGYTAHSSGTFHPSLALTRRFFPHVHNMEGFYVAKFKKLSNKLASADGEEAGEEEKEGDDDDDDDDAPPRARGRTSAGAVVDMDVDADEDAHVDAAAHVKARATSRAVRAANAKAGIVEEAGSDIDIVMNDDAEEEEEEVGEEEEGGADDDEEPMDEDDAPPVVAPPPPKAATTKGKKQRSVASTGTTAAAPAVADKLEGSDAVVDFVAPGEKLSTRMKKKRKAGRKVREARKASQQKRSSHATRLAGHHSNAAAAPRKAGGATA